MIGSRERAEGIGTSCLLWKRGGAILARNFQPTTQPTKCDVLYDLRGVWQSPRVCKLSLRASGPRNLMKIT